MRKRRIPFFKKLVSGRRGQSMIAYALITAAILGGLVTMSMVILPDMLEGYSDFTNSLYFGVNMPFP